MHEVTTASKPALVDISGGGFFIRRVESPGVVKPLARQAHAPSSNKENVPPVGAARAAPKRRTPLPNWYPRTPLRDITSIVKKLCTATKKSHTSGYPVKKLYTGSCLEIHCPLSMNPATAKLSRSLKEVL